MSPALLSLLTFLAVVLAFAGAYSILSDLFLRDRSRVSKRVEEEFHKGERERARRSVLFKDLSPLAAEASAQEDRPGLRQRLETLLEQSGLGWTRRRLLALTAGVGGALGVVGLLHGPLTAALTTLVGAALPLLYVARKRKARLHKLIGQLPDAFDLMSRVIRAGQTVSQALQAVADEFDQPLAGEFSYCYEQQNLGLSSELALRDLARRTGLLEVKIFVLALLVQQQTGGNLAELLDKLATVIRERFKLRGKIRTLTAEGRMQALVLLCLPPLLLLILLVINRDYGQVLLDRPQLLLGVGVSELLGSLWIRKIVNFDF